jgi:CRISPR-associated protein Cas2
MVKKVMYYILTYDLTSSKRLPKLLKLCRKYLNWVQNSTFEGELTGSQFMELKDCIKEIIDKKEDSVFIYAIRTDTVVKKEILGIEKNEISFFV